MTDPTPNGTGLAFERFHIEGWFRFTSLSASGTGWFPVSGHHKSPALARLEPNAPLASRPLSFHNAAARLDAHSRVESWHAPKE